MASTMIPIQACAGSGRRIPDPDRRKNSSFTSWWTPLFGMSSEPDYIDSDNKAQKSESDPAVKASNLRFSGGLTEEKAKQLRKMTVGTESFHDTMYHSAIASRLASDFKACSDL